MVTVDSATHALGILVAVYDLALGNTCRVILYSMEVLYSVIIMTYIEF